MAISASWQNGPTQRKLCYFSYVLPSSSSIWLFFRDPMLMLPRPSFPFPFPVCRRRRRQKCKLFAIYMRWAPGPFGRGRRLWLRREKQKYGYEATRAPSKKRHRDAAAVCQNRRGRISLCVCSMHALVPRTDGCTVQRERQQRRQKRFRSSSNFRMYKFEFGGKADDGVDSSRRERKERIIQQRRREEGESCRERERWES